MKKSIILTIILILPLYLFIDAQNSINWSSPLNIASPSSGNDHPRIALDRNGGPLVIWNHVSRVMFSRWNGGSFTTPTMLNPANINVAGANWMGPDLATHGDTVYVVFKRTPEASDSCHIYCVHSFNGGISFSSTIRVDYINDSLSRFPTVTTDESGNPIIGFMKFNPAFGDARWVVVKSSDYGSSFSNDVKASGWSSTTSTVCDCCPGCITNKGNIVAMLYRDNNSNIRDDWAGISGNTATSFAGGMNIDQQNWYIPACPATGPDGVIVGDTLYSTFMNGGSGNERVYFNKSSVSALTGSQGIPVSSLFPGLQTQNYPRIASDGTAMGIVWKQLVNGSDQCALLFTNNIGDGFPSAYDTVDLANVTNADIEIRNGNIYIVWQDDNSGTVKFRHGTYAISTGFQEKQSESSIQVYPNPSLSTINIQSNTDIEEITITNLVGQIIYHSCPGTSTTSININEAGQYLITIQTHGGKIIRKVSIIP